MIYSYDEVGNKVKVSAPASAGQTTRVDTSYTYFDNGWTKSSSDPWDITATYDYNELGLQTARTLTSAGGSSNRTMGWAYYPDGKLQAKSDNGIPVGQQVVLVDNSDSQNTEITGTWATATTGSGYQGYDYQTHAAGTGTNTFAWKLNIPTDGNYNVWVKYPTGAATNAEYKINYDGASVTKPVDQTQKGGTWVDLGKYAFKAGNASKVILTDNANNSVNADAVKLVRDNSADTDNEKKDVTYTYDANANLNEMKDNSPGAKIATYTVTYNGLNQVSKVEEKDSSGAVKHTTGYTYDANGNPDNRTHDSESAVYAYTELNQVSQVTNKASSTDPNPKVTKYLYTANGLKQKETKGNNNTVDYTYYLDQLLKHQLEKKSDNITIVNEHTLEYNANGDKTNDILKIMESGAQTPISSTLTYTYDPRDRVKTYTKTGANGTSETYVHDANNNVITQTINGTTTNYTYDRNRLMSAVTGSTTAQYNYDPFGRLDTVTAAGKQLEKYTYDGFDRVSQYNKLEDSGTTTITKYAFDPLDRTTSETEHAGAANEKTTEFNYLGLSNDILNEQVAGQITKSYQYSPWGERLSMVKHNSGGTKEDSYYGYNSHSDVEDLTDASGNTRATYGYTAYGKNDDKAFTGVDKPDPANPDKEPYNFYRFNSKRWDPASKQYDMGFRDYNPGLKPLYHPGYVQRRPLRHEINHRPLDNEPLCLRRWKPSVHGGIGRSSCRSRRSRRGS